MNVADGTVLCAVVYVPVFDIRTAETLSYSKYARPVGALRIFAYIICYFIVFNNVLPMLRA
jgi:uncharacterized protein YebE (UPF0316 family)